MVFPFNRISIRYIFFNISTTSSSVLVSVLFIAKRTCVLISSYRYNKNGQLDYLGMAESGVTNPTIVYDFMPEYDAILESKIIYAG